MDRYQERTHETLEDIFAKHDSGLAGIHAVFDWVLGAVVEHPDHRSCLMANSALELGQRDQAVRERVCEHLQRVEERFFTALAQAQASGELRSHQDLRALARLLTNAIHGLGVLSRGGLPSATLRDSVGATLAALGGVAREAKRHEPERSLQT
nr:TetR family transcriptional regulator C-terminal domain-containing protein [Pseudenhygromyxa sp. WMMC2535]